MSPTTSEPLARAKSSKRWITIWCVALGLYVATTIAAECAWRAMRYRASVADSPALWRFWYEYGARGGQRSIVLIGASRIQAGLSTSLMRRRLPKYRISQLGEYGGESAVGVLRELALDKRFCGLVVCDMLEPFLRRERWDGQRILYATPVSRRSQLEAYASARIDGELALRNKDTGIAACLRALATGRKAVAPAYVRLHADRSIVLDFALVDDLHELRERWTTEYRTRYESAEHATPHDLMDELAEIGGFIHRIQARGGQVVFVRFPSTGDRLALEEEYHPRAAYWDAFVKVSSARFIHYQDLRGAAELRCPDDSHLDSDNAVRFTGILVDALIEGHLVEPSK